ncbi:NADP-dependent oxidoreductase [Nocardioides sp. T2.26MG-1]|uniref:NADP-dependent oxidoreductase n=1 Tax=Nocardioides sp. T2.26MG-1 TaxID=3041166 RepID=UPI0024773379|nr:NADP-dependent oxidoreductase [Nocardioides sp. T2.26MG-1]CAI9412677.1 Narbonolide/10-deoxymethynolide synthase PikA2, modules 3 and 4 [Nocardioides sp. T2.26MG-1]
MRALHVPTPGDRPTVGDLPVPEVGEGSVLIRVRAAGLNPIDNLLAAGAMSGMVEHAYPLVVGRDAAGVVEAVGAGVDHLRPGDRVYGHVLLAPPVQAGTVAEYAVLPAAGVDLLPAGLDFATAAAIPLAAAAASAAVDALDGSIGPGSVVLVNGASGGVGSYVVQLLAARQVEVVATGVATDVERLRELGATRVVDHTAGPVVDQVRAAYPDGVDALVNLAGNTAEEIPLGAVAKGGVVSFTTMGPDEESLAAAGLTGTKVMARPVREVTAPIVAKVADGSMHVSVAEVLDLDHAADGLATLARGAARGKIVVVL